MKKLLVILIFLASFSQVHSANFDTVLNVEYLFDQKGIASVTNAISIINRVDNLYVSEYSFTLNDSDYQKFEAHDRKGAITPQISHTDNSTKVVIKLNDQVVGKDQINAFVIRYQTNQYAKVVGTNCEIRLPKISQPEQYKEYQVVVKVPKSCGQIASASPEPSSKSEQKNNLVLNYTNINTLTNGIYLLLGSYQIYEVNWQVSLDNPRNDQVSTYFPLIPDTNYQKTFQQNIQPAPAEVKKDTDGNWLAYYLLEPNQNLVVQGTTVVKVYPLNSNTTDLSADQRQSYLSSTDYWPVNSPVIQDMAKNLSTVKSVYDTIIQKFDYDFDGVGPNRKRLGALTALQSPTKVVCSEYSDLFITLARSLGIPSREHQGYAFSNDVRLNTLYANYDVLHAWPEYYDTNLKKWIMVDPTFGDTSGGIDYFTNFDNSHITFAIHGYDDTRPVPVGGYRTDSLAEKQIKVTALAIHELPLASKIDYASMFNFSKSYLSLVRRPVAFLGLNSSGYPLTPRIANTNEPYISLTVQSEEILPWQRFKITGSIQPKDEVKNYTYQGNFLINSTIVPFSFQVISTSVIAFYVMLLVGILFFGLLLLKLKTKKN